jgi:hypothetical protein
MFLLPALLVAFTKISSGSLRFNKLSLISFIAALLWIASVWISSGAGMLTGENPSDSFQSASRFTGSFVMYLLAYSLGRRDVSLVIYGFVVVSALHASIAIAQYVLGSAADVNGQARATGVLTPNVLSNLLGFGIICWIALLVKLIPNNVSAQKLRIFGSLIFIGLLAAGSLKNIVVLAAVITGYYIISSRRKIFSRTILLASALVLVSPFILMSERIVLRAFESFRNLFSYLDLIPDFTSTVQATDSLLWRYRHWEFLVSDWIQNYLVMGSGVGQARNMNGVRAYYNEDATAHSDWVAIIVEGGLLFTPIWIITIVTMYSCVLISVKHVGERRLFILLVAYLYCIMVAGNVVYTVPFLYLLWILMGVLILPRRPSVMALLSKKEAAS